MSDEASEAERVSKLSTVLWYAHEGKFEGRFVGFTYVSINRCTDGLFNYAQSVISKFNIKSKLVAQTYGEASVMNGDLHGLQAKVLEICPHALHVHCYRHSILFCLRTLTIFQNARYFFLV